MRLRLIIVFEYKLIDYFSPENNLNFVLIEGVGVKIGTNTAGVIMCLEVYSTTTQWVLNATGNPV